MESIKFELTDNQYEGLKILMKKNNYTSQSKFILNIIKEKLKETKN